MPTFVLSVKPDMTKYLLRRRYGSAKSMVLHLSELVIVE